MIRFAATAALACLWLHRPRSRLNPESAGFRRLFVSARGYGATHWLNPGYGAACAFGHIRNKIRLHGLDSGRQYNANRWVGIAADFGGHRGAPITASKTSGVTGLPDESEYYILAGPVVSYRNKTRLVPYAHALFGWERTSLSASTISGSGLASPVPVAATSYDDFTMALGGGLDFKIIHHVALRVPQVDYFHTTLNLTKFYDDALGPQQLFQGLATRQRNARISGGIVYSSSF